MWTEWPVWMFLAINSITDIKTRKINTVLCFLFGLTGGILLVCHGDIDGLSLVGRLLPGVYLLLFSFLTKEAVGIGDGFVVTAAGIWLGGCKTWMVLMGAFALIVLFGVIKIAVKRANRKSEVAFVPFFTLSYVMIFLGRLL